MLLNRQQTNLKCFHCKSHNERDKPLNLLPHASGASQIIFVEEVSYCIYWSGGQGDLGLAPGTRNSSDSAQWEEWEGWHQTPELEEIKGNRRDWEGNPTAPCSSCWTALVEPCPRSAKWLPKSTCNHSCPRAGISKQCLSASPKALEGSSHP